MRTSIKRITRSAKSFAAMVTSMVSTTLRLMVKAALALGIVIGVTFFQPVIAHAIGIGASASATEAPGTMSIEQITANVRSAVVRVDSGWKSGSGFIIDPDGLVLTNNHVIWDANDITISLEDGTRFRGTVQGRDYDLDLAMIKIEASELPTVKLADSSQTPLGSEVLVVGFPLPSQVFTVTKGIASAFSLELYNGAQMIQTDAAVNPGNSGGPLLDRKGQVIGIVTRKKVDVEIEGVGWAISSNTIKGYLERLAEGQ